MDKEKHKTQKETGTPVVSILVPVYNVENYLRPCLDSILAQTFTDFETILVDDGSTDNSGKICDEYAAKDKRFIVVHKQNEGVAKARITAFEHSKGDLITFIDADDYVSLDYLEKLSQPIIRDDADMVSCSYIVVENGAEHVPQPFITGSFEGNQIVDFIRNHYFYSPITHTYGFPCYLWTKMVKRELVGEGLNKSIGIWLGEDQVAVFAMLYKTNIISILPDNLYYYVQHKGQTTRKYDKSLFDSLVRIFESYRDIDINGIARNGIRKRTWRHINNTIFLKMANTEMTRQQFCDDISYFRNQPNIQYFFKPSRVGLGIKEDVKYWILKLKMYGVFFFFVRKAQLRNGISKNS